MKFLLILFAVLFAVSWVAYLALKEPGYVLLGYGNTSVELPLFDFIIALTAFIIIVYLLVQFLLALLYTPEGIAGFRQRKQIRNARRSMATALIQMAEGNWKKAEKLMLSAVRNSDNPVINYLVAAHAAQRQKAPERRDEYLRKASKADPAAEIAVGLAQAELQMYQKQYEEALATLKRLQTISPTHAFIQKLLARLHHKMGDFDSLYQLLPSLRKGGQLTSEEINGLEIATANALLTQAGDAGNYQKLVRLWKNLPSGAQKHPSLIFIHARSLIKLKEYAKAQKVIEQALKHHWDDRLAALYADIEFEDSIKALKQAETWLEEHKESPELLITTARLCMNNGLWGKALSLLNEGLSIKPSARGYQALAELYEQLNEPAKAKHAYEEGFRLLIQQENSSTQN
jgi:HemY protein